MGMTRHPEGTRHQPARPPPLLTTKLHPPAGREQTVLRGRLVERLQAPAGTKLTCLAAPAGYGKTTLLGAWRELQAPQRPIAWLTVDDGDNDPGALWSYSTSIRENVRLGRPAATDEEIEDALREAQILDWVLALPEGWDTLVGEEGRELSGGQRQRLVLARALLSDARVLVLDEPTAHLDSATATALMDNILGATRNRTTLLITHRTEGLDRMDEVHTLAYGRTTVSAGVRVELTRPCGQRILSPDSARS